MNNLINHSFLFQTGNWVGEGSVSFDSVSGRMLFSTSWVIEGKDDQIRCEQNVSMEGSDENERNSYQIHLINETSFDLILENEYLGKGLGSGKIEGNVISWKIKGETGLEGFEAYELQPDGDYIFRAEYDSGQFKTIIEGRIRKSRGSD